MVLYGTIGHHQMAQSCVYTTDGDIVPLELATQEAVFRKMKNVTEDSAHTELCIARMLQIRIISVQEDYYDSELLDIFYEDDTRKADDIKQAIEQLHAMGIVYIDLKMDNMGYSHTDSCWKLFDFDFSGIYHKVDNGSWVWDQEPCHGYNYIKYACKINLGDEPTQIDWMIYHDLFGKDK